MLQVHYVGGVSQRRLSTPQRVCSNFLLKALLNKPLSVASLFNLLFWGKEPELSQECHSSAARRFVYKNPCHFDISVPSKSSASRTTSHHREQLPLKLSHTP